MKHRIIASAAVGAALLAIVGFSMKKKKPSPPAPQPSLPAAAAPAAVAPVVSSSGVVRVPHVAKPPKIDGELEEWNEAGRTGWWVDASGMDVHPASEGRFFWDDQNLYIGLYAADIDIQVHVTKHDEPVWTDDAFRIRLGSIDDPTHPYAIDINAMGVVADARTLDNGKMDMSWESHINVAVDRDEGTINDPRDDDEEWVVESALPWSSIGIVPKPGTVVSIALKRCDTPKGGATVCGTFGEAADGSRVGRLELLPP